MAVFALLGFFACNNNTQSKENAQSHAGQMFVKAVPFQTTTGWGYDIFADNKLYIHQTLIPGVPGKRSFTSREDALKVGELALQKMAQYHKMPSISQADLQTLHIQIPD